MTARSPPVPTRSSKSNETQAWGFLPENTLKSRLGGECTAGVRNPQRCYTGAEQVEGVTQGTALDTVSDEGGLDLTRWSDSCFLLACIL